MKAFDMLAAVVVGLLLAFASGAGAQERGNPQDRFVPVYGIGLHYVEAGIGPAVLLLHGLADDLHVWDGVVAPLSRAHRVIALDLPGFGRSDKPLIEYRPGTLADFVTGFLRALQIERATLIGNSLGGWVAAQVALREDGLVDKLVLVDAAGYADLVRALGPRGMQALRLATRDDLRYLAPRTFRDPRYATEAAIEAAFAERMRAGDGYAVGRLVDAMLRGEDVLDGRLRALERPTLVIWGLEIA